MLAWVGICLLGLIEGDRVFPLNTRERPHQARCPLFHLTLSPWPWDPTHSHFSLPSTMYWSDWGNHPKIETAAMDGTLRETLVQDNIQWPTGPWGRGRVWKGQTLIMAASEVTPACSGAGNLQQIRPRAMGVLPGWAAGRDPMSRVGYMPWIPDRVSSVLCAQPGVTEADL